MMTENLSCLVERMNTPVPSSNLAVAYSVGWLRGAMERLRYRNLSLYGTGNGVSRESEGEMLSGSRPRRVREVAVKRVYILVSTGEEMVLFSAYR